MIRTALGNKALYIAVPLEDLADFRELCQRGGNCWWETAPPVIRRFLDDVKPLSAEPLNQFQPTEMVLCDGRQVSKDHPLYADLSQSALWL